MSRSTVSSKGQIVIPSDVRKVLNIKSGDVINFSIKSGAVYMETLTEGLDDIIGIVDGQGRNASLEDMERVIKSKGGKL